MNAAALTCLLEAASAAMLCNTLFAIGFRAKVKGSCAKTSSAALALAPGSALALAPAAAGWKHRTSAYRAESLRQSERMADQRTAPLNMHVTMCLDRLAWHLYDLAVAGERHKHASDSVAA